MKKVVVVGAMAFASCAGWAVGRTNYILTAKSDWTDKDSYSDASFVPGAGDVVVIPKNTAVSLDASKDAGSLALVNSLERIVVATPTSRLEIFVDEQDTKEVTKSISGYKYADAGAEGMDYTRGPIVKTGRGRLILSSAGYFDPFIPYQYTAYDYYTHIAVSNGTLQLQPLYQQGTVRNTVYYGRVALEADATLLLPYGRNDYGGTVKFMSLAGSGTVSNPVAWPTVKFMGSRANGDVATFSGKLNGSFYVWLNESASADAQTLTGASELSSQVRIGNGQRTAIGSFGNGDGSASPLGVYSALQFDASSGILEYVGGGENSSRPIIMSGGADAASHPTVIDAGATGGVTFTGLWQRHYQGNGQSLVLTGSNTVACVLDNRLLDNADTDDPKGRNHTLYLRKEGTGTWLIKDKGSDRQYFTSGISVDEGTLRYESIDQAGKVCSLGLATHLTDGTVGPDDTNAEHSVNYAIRMGATTFVDKVKKGSACLEYVGAANKISTTRPVALAGTGCLRSSGAGFLEIGPVFGLGAGEKVLILDGDNTGANAVIGVTDGTDGGRVSLVKRGAGKWHLGGEQSFSGTLAVEGGELVARKSTHYSWYRWNIKKLKSGHSWVSIQEFGLFDKDGYRQNRYLDYASSPTRTANERGMYFGLAHGTCAFGDDKPYRITGVYDPSRMFDSTNSGSDGQSAGANFTPDVDVTPGTPATWITVVMRLVAGCNPVTAYDVMWVEGGWNSGKNLGESFTLEGSLDGFIWDELSVIDDAPYRWEGNYWIADNVGGYSDPHSVQNADFQIASAPATMPNVLGSVSQVAIRGGGRLTIEDGKLAISNLVVDGATGGTLDGVTCDSVGSLALENVPNGPDVTIPLTILNAEAQEIARISGWTLTVNGRTTLSKSVELGRDGKLHLISKGLSVVVR